jgi:hypothetical protein
MVKAKDHTPEQRAIIKRMIEKAAESDKARKIIDRANAIRDGQIAPAAVKPKPPSRKSSYQVERVLRVLPKLYPNGTDGISTTPIHRRVVAELKPESKQLGLRDPSLATVARALGRR